MYYNGFRGGEHIDASTDPADCGMSCSASTTTTRVRALGIDNMAVAGVQGRGVMVDLAAHFGARPVRVGYAELMRTRVATISADNVVAVEVIPSTPAPRPSAALPLHELCLFKLGVHLRELWNPGPLARWLRANGRNRFPLTAPPLRLPGTVGSPGQWGGHRVSFSSM